MENELIKITENENGEQLVSARELHEFLEIGQDFTNWIKRMITYGFEENKDFTVAKISEGKVTRHEYVITIDMAKEISMIQRTDKGKQARQYFIKCEKELKSIATKQDSYMIDDPIKRAKRWIEEEEERQRLLLLAQENQEKADFCDNVLLAKDCNTITSISKIYGKSARWLNNLLATEKVQYKQGSRWYLYQKYAEKGYVKDETYLYTTKGKNCTKVNMKWTNEGKKFIYELLKDKYNILPIVC